MSRNDLSRVAHKLFNYLGLEIRLTENIRKAKRLEKEQRQLKQWQLLLNFDIQTIIDIGANEGQFVSMIRTFCPEAHIYSFEPLPEIYEKLCIQHSSDSNITAINLGLSDYSGKTRMFQSSFSPSSSLLPMAELHRSEWPQSAEQTIVDVQIVRLDDWIENNSIPLKPDCLIKLDVQGHELSVLKGGEKTIRKAKLVIVEVSFYELYEQQPLFDTIYKSLCSLGFIYRGSIEQHYSDKSNCILFADAIFENISS